MGDRVATRGAARRAGRGAITAWCLYDFANSAFTTVVVTFIYAPFFMNGFAVDEETGTALWSRGVVITALVVALLSPILGAVADRGGLRKVLLCLFTGTCVAGTLALAGIRPGPDRATLALFAFVVANIAYEMGCALYNAFLPDIAPPSQIGRISGFGWALGYAGGILALLLALPIVVPAEPPFGLDPEAGEPARATAVVTAIWFAIFAVPLFLFVREDRSRVSPPGTRVIRAAFRQLFDTFREIRRYRQVVLFLVARLVFNDGLVTVFAFGGLYASGTFGFSLSKLVAFGILLNVTAALGAMAFGFLDDRLGGRRTILVTLFALVATTIGALITTDERVFWVLTALLGIFVGPNQSASRSLMGRFVPAEKENEFFGFFAFSGKATAFLGPLLLGILTEAYGSQRIGLSVVVAFFVAGGAILWFVDESEGRRAAGRDAGT